MNQVFLKITMLLFFVIGILHISVARKYNSSSSINYSRVDNMKFHYGYSIGMGVFDYRIVNKFPKTIGMHAEVVKFFPALRMGLIGELNITQFLSLRAVPGLYFGKRNINYSVSKVQPSTTVTNTTYSTIWSVYADMPVFFKYRGVRINNYNYYLLGGLSYKLDLVPHKNLSPDENVFIRTKISDFALEFGGGMDFYNQYFRLGVELRISIGLIDIMNHNLVKDMPTYKVYTESIKKLNSIMVTLSFNFE